MKTQEKTEENIKEFTARVAAMKVPDPQLPPLPAPKGNDEVLLGRGCGVCGHWSEGQRNRP